MVNICTGKKIFPAPANIFNAFNLCPLDKVKVVMIGQDPYHEPGQAHGLCFSVLPPTPVPPSLVNIYKEIENDLGHPVRYKGGFNALGGPGCANAECDADGARPCGDPTWARGGSSLQTLLFARLPNVKNIVYMLWGSYAQRKAEFVKPTK